MPNPIMFQGVNVVMNPPKGYDEKTAPEKINDLPIYDDGQSMTSVWELTDDERKVIAEGGAIAFSIFQRSHPVIAVGVVTLEKPASIAPETDDGDESPVGSSEPVY